jgi:predicted RNA-binding protein YlxR (DUF448 family)
MPPKKVSMRMCVGCREMKEKKQLIRIVHRPEKDGGGIALDLRGKMNGRGAYICRDVACLQKARKIRALERALEVNVPGEIYEQLGAQLLADDGSPQ